LVTPFSGADLVIRWERTQISLPLTVDIDAHVLAQIDARVRKAQGTVKAQTYFDAVMFLCEKEHDLDEAARGMDLAVAGRPTRARSRSAGYSSRGFEG
jgi:hypothetical protein